MKRWLSEDVTEVVSGPHQRDAGRRRSRDRECIYMMRRFCIMKALNIIKGFEGYINRDGMNVKGKVNQRRVMKHGIQPRNDQKGLKMT